MNKVDVVLERCSINLIDEFDSAYYIEDGYQYLMETIQQTATGATKKNIFQKLWDGIIRIWRWICKQWNRFIDWATRRGKKRKGADDVFESINGSKGASGGNTPPPSGGSDAPGTPPATPPAEPKEDAPKATTAPKPPKGKIETVKVEVPSSEKSEFMMDKEVELMLKPLKVRYDEEKDGYGISINDANRMADGAMQGQGVAAFITNSWFAELIILMDRPQVMDHFIAAIDSVQEMPTRGGNGTTKYVIGSDFVNHIDAGMKLLGGTVSNYFVVPFKAMKNFQQQLNALMSKLEVFQQAGDNYEYTIGTGALDSLNKLMSYSANIQMAMNAFTRCTQGYYYIDARYKETINDPVMLDKFVKGLIQEGYPPKIVGLNAYCASTPELRGDASKDHPIWGQSRAVLFPTNNTSEIIKVALSGWGIASNRSEFNIYQKLAPLGGSKYLTATSKVEANGAVVHSERINTKPTATEGQINAVTTAIKNIIRNNHLAFKIDDAHSGNFGFRGNDPVFLDYAWISRTLS